METALDVFAGGLFGVFAGMAVLYLMMRLTSLAVGRLPAEPGLADEKAPGKKP